MKAVLIILFLLLAAVSVSSQICTLSQSQQCGITDIGECRFGLQNCVNGYWGICEGAIYPKSEVCFDELDNDCDNQVDEDCECVSGTIRDCGFSKRESASSESRNALIINGMN